MSAARASKRRTEKLAFLSSGTPEAERARGELVKAYGEAAPEDADVIVALGGDGLMLQTLHAHMDSEKPIYGMNRGSVGFLMNEFSTRALRERIAAAETSIIHPLVMRARTKGQDVVSARAINEVSLLRASYQAAKMRISVDGAERLRELVADGILVATPAGSTAYNLSVNGPIVPLGANLMALTPISVRLACASTPVTVVRKVRMLLCAVTTCIEVGSPTITAIGRSLRSTICGMRRRTPMQPTSSS